MSKKKQINRGTDVVLQRMFDHIRDHCVRTFAEHKGAPLMLTFHGPAGMGKTYTLDRVLKKLNVRIFRMSPSEFESVDAGEPARILAERYLAASLHVEGRSTDPFLSGQSKNTAGQPACVVVDDIDLALGRFGNDNHTVNNQHVCSLLMHLADRPNEVTGTPCRSVPIFLTCNDVGRLYSPLVRPGRMELVSFELNEKERMNIIAPMFPSLTLDEIESLITSFDQEAIAFFGDVRRYLDNELLRRSLARYKSDDVIQLAVQKRIAAPSRQNVSYSDVVEVASFLLQARVIKNHLRVG